MIIASAGSYYAFVYERQRTTMSLKNMFHKKNIVSQKPCFHQSNVLPKKNVTKNTLSLISKKYTATYKTSQNGQKQLKKTHTIPECTNTLKTVPKFPKTY